MLDAALLASIANELMTQDKISVQGRTSPVRRTSSHRLRTASFKVGGRAYQAIEQNAEKPSRWGQLARDGHHVVQFKDVERNRFVAVSVDGKIVRYGAAKKP